MNWHLLSTVHITLGLTSLVAAVVIFRLKSTPEIRGFSLGLISAAIWMTGYAFQLSSTEPVTLLFWEKITFSGMMILPTSYHFSTLRYAGYLKTVRWWHILLSAIVPFLSIFLLFTNDKHAFFWDSTSIDYAGTYPLVEHTYRPGFWIIVGYSALLVLASVVVLLYVRKSSKYYYTRGIAILTIAGTLIMILAIGEFGGHLDFLGFRPTGLVLATVGIIVSSSILSIRRREVVKLSRLALFERSADAYIVFDPTGKITDFNYVALELLDASETEIKGKYLHQFWPRLSQMLQENPHRGKQKNLEITHEKNHQIYQIIQSDLRDWKEQLLCEIIILKNITEFKQRSKDLSTIIQTSNAASSSLELSQVLFTLADRLSTQSGFQRCVIYAWHEEDELFRCLVEYARVIRAEKSTEMFNLKDYPTTELVLKTGITKLINKNTSGEVEEIALLEELGQSALLMTPLWSGSQIIGLVEVASNDPRIRFDQNQAARCYSLIKNASKWIFPLIPENPEDKLFELAEELIHICMGSMCFFSTWDKRQGTVTTFLEYNNSTWYPGEGPEYRLEDWPDMAAAIKSDNPQLINLNDPSIAKESHLEMSKWGAKSKLLIPLCIKEKPIGVIEFHDTNTERVISEEQLNFLKALGDQASIAIQNAKLHYDAQQQLREQKALVNAVTAISSALDLNNVLSQIAKQLTLITSSTSAYICSHEPIHQISRVIAEFLSPDASPDERQSDINQAYLEDDREFTHKMQSDSYAIHHIDDPNLSQFQREHMEQYDAKTILYIPLITKGALVGFAEIWDSRRKRAFGEKEITLCKTICRHAAVAMENAELFEKTKNEIIERKKAEAKLFHEANHDALTSLPNRTLLIDRLQQMIYRSRRMEGHFFAVLFIDLDNFKNINDNFGHPVGDQYLIEVGKRFSRVIRESDTVGRLGGDEFLILLDGVTDIIGVTLVAERIHESLNPPIIIDGHQITSSASIGIVVNDPRYKLAEEIIRDADIAMYRAKELGRARHEYFDQSMRDKVLARLNAEDELNQAIAHNEFVIHYQPIVSLNSKQILGIEALVRWKNNARGLLPASAFIPLAEEIGKIQKIDEWVLDNGLRQWWLWKNNFPAHEPWIMTINISRMEFAQSDFVEKVHSAIEKYNIEASNIGIEITESLIASDADAAVATLNNLKSIGVKILLDDFGKEYSTLNNLIDFPIDFIKVDKRFVQKISTKRGRGVMKTIISMGQDLDMKVIVEGIETEKQLEILQSLKCEFGQGYHLSKPIDPTYLDVWVATRLGTDSLKLREQPAA
jgi:diguanylate cyclase (GGDEF)-like protein/PAS domain S-box-containing protein